MDMVLLNANQRYWPNENYLNFHVAADNPHYIALKQYMLEKEISLQTALALIYGFENINQYRCFKDGFFKFPEGEEKDKVDNLHLKVDGVIKFLRQKILGNKKFLESSRLKLALIKLFSNPTFCYDTFLKKLSQNMDAVVPCSRLNQFYDLFKHIYNYNNKKKME